MITERALYGLESSGDASRTKLAETLMFIGYKPSEVDADIWMKRDFKPNEDPYYKYMICYADELLHIGFNPKEYMDALNMIYWLNDGFVTPDLYLGANVEKVQLKDGRVVWYTNCVDY